MSLGRFYVQKVASVAHTGGVAAKLKKKSAVLHRLLVKNAAYGSAVTYKRRRHLKDPDIMEADYPIRELSPEGSGTSAAPTHKAWRDEMNRRAQLVRDNAALDQAIRKTYSPTAWAMKLRRTPEEFVRERLPPGAPLFRRGPATFETPGSPFRGLSSGAGSGPAERGLSAYQEGFYDPEHLNRVMDDPNVAYTSDAPLMGSGVAAPHIGPHLFNLKGEDVNRPAIVAHEGIHRYDPALEERRRFARKIIKARTGGYSDPPADLGDIMRRRDAQQAGGSLEFELPATVGELAYELQKGPLSKYPAHAYSYTADELMRRAIKGKRPKWMSAPVDSLSPRFKKMREDPQKMADIEKMLQEREDAYRQAIMDRERPINAPWIYEAIKKHGPQYQGTETAEDVLRVGKEWIERLRDPQSPLGQRYRQWLATQAKALSGSRPRSG